MYLTTLLPPQPDPQEQGGCQTEVDGWNISPTAGPRGPKTGVQERSGLGHTQYTVGGLGKRPLGGAQRETRVRSILIRGLRIFTALNK